MIKIFKILFLCMVFYAGMFFGEISSNIKQQRKELAKDPSGRYHRVCESQIMGKLNGKPCDMCRTKWQVDHTDEESFADKVIKYCEKIKGKDLLKFTDEEMRECLLMMLNK